MALHRAIFEYKLPEWGSIEFDVDESLDHSEKEEIALAEIKELYEDVEDIAITDLTII